MGESMQPAKTDRKHSAILTCILWVLEGILVGFGAILPGVSGGALCAAFGMYHPLIETFSAPKDGIRKYWRMLLFFAVGAGIGFVGLSGLTARLMDKNTTLVVCAFTGFILGTLPDLWHEAGEQGRPRGAYWGLVLSFLLMLGALTLLKTQVNVTIAPGIPGYLLCGALWGLSFIVPGLSSSSLLLFFDLYKPMSEGIARLDMLVLLPMAVSGLLCVLLLSKAVSWAYKRWYAIVSHCVMGIVAATAVMILPVSAFTSGQRILGLPALLVCPLLICLGALTSYWLTILCSRLKRSA